MKRFSRIAFAVALTVACQQAPRPLVAGSDACAYCRMGVADVRFGGELQARSGRLFTFDAIECLTSFFLDADARGDVRNVWVSDYETSQLIPVDSALFIRSEKVHSPMGRSFIALAVRDAEPEKLAHYAGDVLRWVDVVEYMRGQQVVPSVVSTPRHDVPAQRLTSGIDTIVVAAGSAMPTISAAIAVASAGDHIVVRPGVYKEPTIRIAVPLTLRADSGATLDGEGMRALITVAANDVTVRGLTLRNTGASHIEDRAAIRVEGAHNCRVEENRVEHALFGIYLSGVSDCTVRKNTVRGDEASQTLSGNGIHVWQSERVQLLDNHVTGHRDGIYFEFVKDGDVRHNVSERSDRYGLHFMFSDDCRYENNLFRANGAGVAVMYTKRVHMLGNRFERNWGSSAYGLLLKDINDSEIRGNEFIANSVALHLEGSSANRIERNAFRENGWALRVLANAQDNIVAENSFTGNSFDVATNSRQNFSTFRENYWDRYRGYDLDRDGFADAPYAPVRLFALIVEQSPAALILQRSIVVDLLDLAERVLPVLTPATLVDERPRMRPPNATRGGA
jgi:nitrous oxidase accessory protein